MSSLCCTNPVVSLFFNFHLALTQHRAGLLRLNKPNKLMERLFSSNARHEDGYKQNQRKNQHCARQPHRQNRKDRGYKQILLTTAPDRAPATVVKANSNQSEARPILRTNRQNHLQNHQQACRRSTPITALSPYCPKKFCSCRQREMPPPSPVTEQVSYKGQLLWLLVRMTMASPFRAQRKCVIMPFPCHRGNAQKPFGSISI